MISPPLNPNTREIDAAEARYQAILDQKVNLGGDPIQREESRFKAARHRRERLNTRRIAQTAETRLRAHMETGFRR